MKKIITILMLLIMNLIFAGSMNYSYECNSKFGKWNADFTLSVSELIADKDVKLDIKFTLDQDHYDKLINQKTNLESFIVLVTAERTFDPYGFMRFPSDEKMSTILTPSGLPVEGGSNGCAVSKRYSLNFNTPLEFYGEIKLNELIKENDKYIANFSFNGKLPVDLPPGIYRIRSDFGIRHNKNRVSSINLTTFAQREFSENKEFQTYVYSPTINSSGIDVNGNNIDASKIIRQLPWVILYDYNSNGYRGVVADEDKNYFNLSSRNIIQDGIILPLYNEKGRKTSYNIEPQFPGDAIDQYANIKWDYSMSELKVKITDPDMKITDLGKFNIVEKHKFGITTKRKELTSWSPSKYGFYKISVTGFIYDQQGNKYTGGGTYGFWIANRLTMATATFQGMSYPVGSKYGKDIVFIPSVPADVEVKVFLYPDSEKNDVKSMTYIGKATASGLFSAAQGLKPFVLEKEGEYYAKILAKYIDNKGNLWICSMTHAGVVYPENSDIIAHGKKMTINGKLYDRGDTNFEGYVDQSGDSHLAHINYPYNKGDELLISAEYEGINKIEPVMIYEIKGKEFIYDKKWQGIGRTNVSIKTSNGYSPHLFPEYITSMEYYYGAAPRPGFMSRFLIGDDGLRAPYWPTSNTNFGGQFGASNNGDMPGDIYRLLGGVVVRNKDFTGYDGYIATAIIIPKGSNNNKIIEAGTEDITGPDGRKSRFFLTGLRPGSNYEIGAGIVPVVQVDPILPVNIKVTLVYPDFRMKTATGIADKFGYFAGSERWIFDKPGIYYYKVMGNWLKNEGFMPGLPREGGHIYVYNKDDPLMTGSLKLDVGGITSFPVDKGFIIRGSSNSKEIYYSILMPGAVIDQGKIRVKNNQFEYEFNPVKINKKIPIYDIKNIEKDKDEIGRIVHITFFSREKNAEGRDIYELRKIILRGNKIVMIGDGTGE